MSALKYAYKAVLDEFGIDPEDDTYSGGEDAGEFMSGEREIERFCSVTQSGDFFYANPITDDFDSAKERCVMYIGDPLYAEMPVCVIDLETGQRWEPDWSVITWQEVKAV
jgi:hypothetical protein